MATILRRLLRSSLAVPLAAAALGQAPPRTVDDVLPSSTYAVVRFGGLAACRAAASELPFGRLVDAFAHGVPAELRARHVEAELDRAADHVQRVLARAGMPRDDLRALLARPMALAIGRLTIEGMGPSLALVIDAGDSAPAIGRCVNALAAGVGGDAASAVEIGGVPLRHFVTGEGVPVFFGGVDGWFLVTNSRGYAHDLVQVARGARPGLAAATCLGRLQASLPAAPLASLFVHVEPFAAMFDAHLPYEAVDLADAAGIGRLDAVHAATTATAAGGVDVLHVGLHGSTTGALKAAFAAPVDLGFAAFCSNNTVAFGAGSADVPAVVGACERLVSLLPAPVRQPLRRAVGQALRADLGMPGQAVIAALRAFGPRFALALALEKGAVPKPELLLRLEVRDRPAVADLLQRLEARTSAEGGAEWRSRPVGGHEIRFCHLELPNGRLQLSPCYALLADELVCGSDVAALARALHQQEDAGDSLAVQPDFRAMAADSAGQSGIVHLRLFRAVELGWRTVESWGYPRLDAHAHEIGFGSEALPDPESIAATAGTATLAFRIGEDGIVLTNRGALAVGQLVAAGGLLLDEVLGRSGARIY